MILFMFIMLASYAVRCDDTSYYVIQMPENDPPIKLHKKPFRVYWNVPTMQCKSKRIPFESLYEKFGILQNKNDSFRGEKIAILYDPGLFPALLKNETSGKFKFRNGGVPQEGDLEKHLASFKSVLDQSIPDHDFNGVGIIDFESWRPVFRQNFGVLVPYKDVSYEIEKKLHWWWPQAWIQAEAKQRFEQSAHEFMQSTLILAKQMRPNALWGYYGFPYCFNMATNNHAESCANKVPEENDSTYWLWSKSTALYPSVYSSKELTSSQLAGLIRGRVKEAARVKRSGTPILPYFWFRYRDGSYLKKDDLDIALQTLYKSNASGFIIWGSSNDVNTVDKCLKLQNYIENVMGPAIAKYTKDNKLENYVLNDSNDELIESSLNTTTTTAVSVQVHKEVVASNLSTATPDPEFHWDPPENYTQELTQYVIEELSNNSKYNNSNKNELNEVELSSIDMIINILLNDQYNDTETDNTMFNDSSKESGDVTVFTEEAETTTLPYSTTETSSGNNYETTTVIVDLSEKDSLEKSNENYKKDMLISEMEETTEVTTVESSTFVDTFYTSTVNNTEDYGDLFMDDQFSQNYTDYVYEEINTTITDSTTESLLVDIITGVFNEKISTEDENKGLPEDILISTQNYETTSDSSTNLSDDIITIENVGVKNKKKGLPKSTNDENNDLTNEMLPFTATTAFVEQIAGSATGGAVVNYLHYISFATYLLILPL
ncbi:uncharacterized protein LOC113509362 [Galleria mellonella]|uniref:Hyaluronidase n=1 Tax=Galleria mellonella TaxID=7137 RepID=A0ABM3MEB3_GALME|nr:uncharacterized protein LOC113509362 [Galleria mellonella]